MPSRESLIYFSSVIACVARNDEVNQRLPNRTRRYGLGLLLTSLALLNACGGGGDGGNNTVLNSANITYTPGVFARSSTFANQCAAPRSGTSDRQGSTTAENFWLRSWSHELYLWYRELPEANPANSATTAAYFNLMKTSAITSTGKAKDRFHFTYPTDAWLALSQSGVSAGYGAEWYFVTTSLPRDLRVAFVEPNSPAANAGLSRGVRILSIDGADLLNGNTQSAIDTLNAGLSPSAVGETHSFIVRELNGTQHPVTMTSANVTSTPVQNVTTLQGGNGTTVGYLLFNDHIATSEPGLINAFTQLQQANVSDLILDIRYNGGGYLDIASEVAYMIAGASATNNRTFELTRFNDQYASTDPVTGRAITPMPFHSIGGFGATAGTPLPTLNLPRVFVITGSGTCSASESIINGLRGIGMTVIQVGSTTCGKPYGFYPQDNCGTTYFSIEFQDVNATGFGDYPDGFSPQNTPFANAGVLLPGCSVADDFTHALGSAAEGRLAAALSYRQNSICSVPASGDIGRSQIQSVNGIEAEPLTIKEPWRESRILTR